MKTANASIVPWLRYSHPGYFMVILSLIFVHGVLAVDALFPSRHTAPIFEYEAGALTFISIAHFVILVTLIVALYLPVDYWWLARVVCIWSILVFNSVALLLILSLVQGSPASFQTPTLYLALSMSSAAAAREPLTRKAVE